MGRSAVVATIAAAGAVAVGACGEDRKGNVEVKGGDTSTESTSTAPKAPLGAASATVTVKETEYRLDPADPEVKKAGVVQFKAENIGKITHALEVEGPSGEAETAGIEPGKTATLKADLSKPGRYEWYCPIADHKDRGMKGEIVVAGGGGAKSEDESSGGTPSGY